MEAAIGCRGRDGPVAFRVVLVTLAAGEILGVEQWGPAGLVGYAPMLEYEQDAGRVVDEGVLYRDVISFTRIIIPKGMQCI